MILYKYMNIYILDDNFIYKLKFIHTMDAKKKYKNYSERTKEWMQQLFDALAEGGKQIPPAFMVSLDLLADAVEVYEAGMQSIRDNGVMVANDRGYKVKNPAITIVNNEQNYIVKMLTQYGLTKLAKARLAKIDDEDGEASPLDEFLS